MILNYETENLMREWSDHLQQGKQKPLFIISANEIGEISLVKVNEVTPAMTIDIFERLTATYKKNVNINPK